LDPQPKPIPHGNETMFHKTQIWFGLFALISLCFFTEPVVETVAADTVVPASHQIKNRPIATNTRGYISSDSCRECHTHHYDTWHASHHRTMTQVPSKETVIADFDNKIIVHSGREFRFFHEDSKSC